MSPPYTAPEYGVSCVPCNDAGGELMFIACGSSGSPCLYPYDAKVQISFYPSGGTLPETPHVIYPALPGGRYGRMILLGDDSSSTLSVRVDREPVDISEFPWHTNTFLSTRPCRYIESRHKNYSISEITPAKNQEDTNGVFQPLAEIKLFREIRQHGSDFFSNWEFLYKVPPSLRLAMWPIMENSDPVEIIDENIYP